MKRAGVDVHAGWRLPGWCGTRPSWRLLAITPLVLALALVACGQSAAATLHQATGTCTDLIGEHHPPNAILACYVTFAPTVTYAQALRTVTDLGMQPALPCASPQTIVLNGRMRDLSPHWQPVGQRALFLQLHGLVVYPNVLAEEHPLSARSWVDQLRYYSPSIIALRDATPLSVAASTISVAPVPQILLNDVAAGGDVKYTCTPILPGPLLTGDPPLRVIHGATATYAQVAFSPTITYDTALAEVSNLGLRLADPCFETAVLIPNAPHLPAEQIGQEAGFAKTQTLIVATTLVASTLWRQQTSASVGVVAVSSASGTSCAQ